MKYDKIYEQLITTAHKHNVVGDTISVEDGHTHSLYPACRRCRKVRELLLRLGRGFTEIAHDANGVPHRHWIKGDIAD